MCVVCRKNSVSLRHFTADVQDDWHSGEGDADVEGKIREMQQITAGYGTGGMYHGNTNNGRGFK